MKSRNVPGLDIARSVAIVLAMVSHCLVTVDAIGDLETISPALKLPLRASTPTFIVLFGVMLEYVYKPLALAEGVTPVVRRMFARATQCYTLYLLSIVALVATGKMSFVDAVFTSALHGSTPFTDILRYYALLFIVSPALLVFRLRYGMAACLLVVSAVQLLHPLLAAIPEPPMVLHRPLLAKMPDLLLGIGTGVAGPSLLHSLFFVAVGSVIGAIIARERTAGTSLKAARGEYSLLICGLAVGALGSAWIGPEPVNLKTWSGMDLRSANHPLFFFWGSLVATCLIVACRKLRDRGSGAFRLSMLGQRSLFTFCFGNSLLYLVPRLTLTVPTKFAVATFLFCAVVASSALYDRLVRKGAKDDPSATARALSARVNNLLEDVNARLTRFSARVAHFVLNAISRNIAASHEPDKRSRAA